MQKPASQRITNKGVLPHASLGRFLSADPFFQDVTNLQALNAYSYVLNNRLSFTDPSGFFFSKLFKAIGNFFKSVFRAIGNVFKAILKNPIIRAVIQIAACAYAMPACLAVTAGLTLAAGGSIVEAVSSAAFAFVSAGVWGEVGQFLKAAGLAGNILAKGVIHGVVGGALSVAQGGTFMDGFIANAIGGATGVLSEGTAIGSNIYTDTALVALSGGLAAELTGGKFANGAITAAFANIFNKWRLDKKVQSMIEEIAAKFPPPPTGGNSQIPEGPWRWAEDPSNSRGGTYIDPQGRSASWHAPDGHWDIDDGRGNRQRYNRWGYPLSVEEAHGDYDGPRRLPLPRYAPLILIPSPCIDPYICPRNGS